MNSLVVSLRRPAAFSLVLGLAVVLGSTLGCGGGSGGDDNGNDGATLQLTSTAFTAGAAIPFAHAYSGAPCSAPNESPPLSWSWTPSQPSTVQSYAVVMHDSTLPWTHWILLNIPATTTSLTQNTPFPAPAPLVQTSNSFNQGGYGGPCPQAGPAQHTYVFTVWALSVPDVTALPGYDVANPDVVRNLIQANSVASGSHSGTYTR